MGTRFCIINVDFSSRLITDRIPYSFLCIELIFITVAILMLHLIPVPLNLKSSPALKPLPRLISYHISIIFLIFSSSKETFGKISRRHFKRKGLKNR